MTARLSAALALALAAALFTAPAVAADENPPPAQQAPPAPAAPTQPAAAPGSPDEEICKVRTDAMPGTRIAKKIRICRTRREWDEEKRVGQGSLDRVQRSNGSQSGLLQMGPAGKGQPKAAN
jgi:hypothetical protein